MTTSPAATPLTLPDAFTVATEVLLLDHVTVAVPVIALSTVAVSVSLPDAVMLVDDLFSERAVGSL